MKKDNEAISVWQKYVFCDPTGNRTPVDGMRIRRPKPLDDGAKIKMAT